VIEIVFPTAGAYAVVVEPGADAHDDVVPPGTPGPVEARRLLGLLPRRAAGATVGGYDRDRQFGGWGDADGNGCNTRQDVLRWWVGTEAGRSGCTVSGPFTDPYTGQVVQARPGPGVQIDHVVALREAWNSGAAGWEQTRRIAYANDRRHLIPTDGAVNEDKSAKPPQEWMPPDSGYWCEFAAVRVGVQSYYGLSVTAPEVEALERALATCTVGAVGPGAP